MNGLVHECTNKASGGTGGNLWTRYSNVKQARRGLLVLTSGNPSYCLPLRSWAAQYIT